MITRVTIMTVSAVLAFAVSWVLLASPAPSPTPSTPDQVRVVASAWKKVPRESWIAVDERAWNRFRDANPLRKLPDDCARLFTWAQQHELNPSVPLQYLLTITADDRVHVRLHNAYAVQSNKKLTPQRPPIARMHVNCENDSGTEDSPGSAATRVDGRTFSASEKVKPEGFYESYVFDMGKETETTLQLAIDSLTGISPYDYEVIVGMEVDGSLRKFTLNDEGRPFHRR